MGRGQAITHDKPKSGLTVWFTGLSGAGKTTICRYVQMELATRDLAVEVLDGDVVRTHLCKDLGYSEADRKENIRRIAHVARDAHSPWKDRSGGRDFSLSKWTPRGSIHHRQFY